MGEARQNFAKIGFKTNASGKVENIIIKMSGEELL
jgi:hypothetical protein